MNRPSEQRGTQYGGPYPQQGRPWVLCVDFGTSNTVAAVAEPGRAPRVLTVDNAHAVPSAVYLDEDGTSIRWLVGRSAESSAARDPTRYAPNPKRQVMAGEVNLGGRAVPVHHLIGAVLHKVFAEAWRQHDSTPPAVLVLTHPARWRSEALGVLGAAARTALDVVGSQVEPVLVAEPVAAAWHATQSRHLADRARVVVLDLGGGTCDVAVVDRVGDRFQLAAAPLGIDPLGGEDFDARLAQAVLDDLGEPELTRRLTEPATPLDRLAYLDLRRSCRGAKEELSDQVRANVRVPAVPGALPEGASVQVSRPHRLEPLLTSDGPDRPGLDTAADLVRQSMDQAPPTTTPTSVFLVGGSSRIPLLGNLVHQRTGLVPLEHGDPGTAVAEGGASVALAALEGRSVPTTQLPVLAPDTAADDVRERGPHVPVTPDEVTVGQRKRRTWGWWALGGVAAVLLVLAALGALSGSTTGGTTDSGTDTGVDTGTDTGTDPGGEGGGVLTVACWDGSTASTAVSCPPLEGEDAVVWVVGSTGAGDAVADCVELLAEPNRGEEEVWQCDTEDMTVLLTRWSSPALAAAYFSNDYATVLPLTSEDGTNGTEWQDCLYDTITCIAWAYDDRPFSQEVFGPNSELVADVYDRLSAKDGTTIDASAP